MPRSRTWATFAFTAVMLATPSLRSAAAIPPGRVVDRADAG